MTHKQPYQPVSGSSLLTRHVERVTDTNYSFRFNILSALMDTLPLLLFLLASAAAAASDPQVMTVRPGDDVTLKCEAGDVSIRAVEWSRADLEPQYVLFYRDRRSYPTKQHPSFKGRVELEDRDLKDGDVSLTLKNVTSRDNGTYECRVATGGSTRTKRANIDGDPIRAYRLEVRDSEDGSSSRGHIGVAVGVGVAVLLLAAAVFVAVWRYRRRTDQRSAQSSLKGSDDPLI